MNIEIVKIEEIKKNPNNPRYIKDEKYKKLVKSIVDFPEMLKIRPIVVDADNMVLGGNMRLKSCQDAGLVEVPILKATELTEEQKKEFIIKDNQSFGDWDMLTLKDWDKEMLLRSGFEDYQMIDIFGINDLNNKYTGNIEGSNFNPEAVNVDDFIKQNIFFFNELMLEFEDDKIKKAIKNIKDTDQFKEEIKKIILKYGKDRI